MKSGEFIDTVRQSFDPAQILGVVGERVNDLEASVEPIKFVAGGDKITYQYIHPQSAVKAYPYSKGFRVNDDKIHEGFAQEVTQIAKYDGEPDELVLKASMLATLKYFVQSGNEKRRKRIHGGIFRGKVQDLSTINQEGAAMCVEMAAVTHNLNMVGGVVSALMLGAIDTGNGQSGHAWQLVRQGDDNAVFDVTRTIPERRNDGSVIAHPFVGKVNALDLLTGKTVSVSPEEVIFCCELF